MADTVSASAHVAAEPAAVFDFIRQPVNHPTISGDQSVRANFDGPTKLSMGDKFGMKMKLLGAPYRIHSKVVEFEQDRRIAWCHLGRHRWRWELEPAEGGTKLTETFDMSTSLSKLVLRIMGYPEGHRSNVEQSVANVAAHFAS